MTGVVDALGTVYWVWLLGCLGLLAVAAFGHRGGA